MKRTLVLLVPALFLLGGALVSSRQPAERTGTDEVSAGRSPVNLASRPAKGPELERWYFGRWYEPEPAELSPEFLERAWDELERVPAEESALSAVNTWQLKGPLTMQQASGARWTGRVLDVEFPPGQPVRVAAASGGLWTYEFLFPIPLSDDVTSLAVGSVATNPNDPDHIIIGTGELYVRTGTGIWETRDRGATWQQRLTGTEMNSCVRVRWDPHNAMRVYAVGSGAWRSTDAGLTWTNIDGGAVTDIDFHPTLANRIYTYRTSVGAKLSTNGGTTWSTLGSFPGSPDLGRGSIAVAPSNPSYVYCAVAAFGPNASLEGVFRSTNGGTSWTDVSPANYMANQGWYNNVIDVSPLNPAFVLAGGVTLMKTNSGGNSWTEVVNSNLHVDYHCIRWSDDGAKIYVGTDGGWMHSSDGGANWNSQTNVVPITQFYHFDTGRNAPQLMVGGSQDNGFARTSNGGATWDRPFGADGGAVVIDPFVQDRWWVTNGVYSGGLAFRRLRTTNAGANWQDQNAGIASSSQWVPQIRDDGVNPVWLYTTSARFMYQSTDLGVTWTSMTGTTAFSADISSITLTDWTASVGSTIYACLDSNVDGARLRVFTGTWAERGWGFDNRVRKVSVQGNDPYGAYALIDGTNDAAKVWRTENRGQSWVDITGNLPTWIPVSDLVRHPTDSDRLYLGTAFGCFRTEDGGTTWERWNNGMPEATIVTEMVGVDSLATSGKFFVYASTYGRGIWARDISGDDPVDVAVVPPIAPEVQFEAPRPNPARGRTSLAFSLPKDTTVDLAVYDVAGRRVATLAEGAHAAGRHEVAFDASGVAAGVYWARLVAPGVHESQRIVLVR